MAAALNQLLSGLSYAIQSNVYYSCNVPFLRKPPFSNSQSLHWVPEQQNPFPTKYLRLPANIDAIHLL